MLTKTVKQAPGASNYIEHLICVRVYGDLRSRSEIGATFLGFASRKLGMHHMEA